jgi:chromosome segregation ATPase
LDKDKLEENELRGQRQQCADQLREHNASTQRISNEVRNALSNIKTLKDEKAAMQKSGAGGKLQLYGAKVPDVVRAIAADQAKGLYQGKVYGPLGNHMRLHPEFKRFGKAIEACLSKTMSSFLVSCGDDRNQLLKTLRLAKIDGFHNIIVQKPFERQRVDPIPLEGVRTIAEALIVDDKDVFNILLETAGIEHTILIESDETLPHVTERLNGRVQFKHPKIHRSVSSALSTDYPYCNVPFMPVLG